MKDESVIPSVGLDASTSLSLLERVRRGENAAWSQLVRLYEPLVQKWCIRARLQAEDAANVCQEVFAAVARSIADFDREICQGTFRGWLRTITQHKIVDRARQRRRSVPTIDGSAANDELAQAPADLPIGAESERTTEERQVIYRRALELIKSDFEDRTWKAFLSLVVDEIEPSEVARQLGMSLGAVYVAKSRVLARLRSEFAGLLEQ